MDNFNPNSNESNTNDKGFESEATRVEVGDNFVIISDELKNGDPFYVLFYDQTLHECKATFENDLGNTWYVGEMFLHGVWYHHVLSQWGNNNSYRLLHDDYPSFAYSHLVLKSKFAMLLVATRKGNSQFSMPLKIRENLLVAIEEQQHYGEFWTN